MKKYVFLLFLPLLFFITPDHKAKADYLNPTYYPGVKVTDGYTPPYKPVRPTTYAAAADAPDANADGCHAGPSVSTFKTCIYGPSTYNYTVMMVGDSHTSQWLGTMQQFMYSHKIRVVLSTKSACAFSSTYRTSYPTCNKYNSYIWNKILEVKPDAVITKFDQNGAKAVEPGTLARIKQLSDRGIRVMALRAPVYYPTSAPECVRQYGRYSTKCAFKKNDLYPTPSNYDKLTALQRPAKLHYVDFKNRMCPDTYCYPVQGNILKARDRHHMTDSYVRTFPVYFARELMPLLTAARNERLAAAQ